jgi:probable phosphoglycerate mutase
LPDILKNTKQSDNGLREVWFIRHGESVANAGGRTTEAATYPLTERGYRQAEQLAAGLERTPDLIVHSPYVRARETAEPAMRRFPKTPVEVWPVQEVQYLDPALCVGTTQDERHVLAMEYWQKCDPLHRAPNAESFADFVMRAHAALEAVSKRSEPLTYIFCHGHFMRALAWLLLFRPAELSAAAMRHFMQMLSAYIVYNCAIQTVYLHPGGERSLGGLWVLPGVEHEPLQSTLRGQEGT